MAYHDMFFPIFSRYALFSGKMQEKSPSSSSRKALFLNFSRYLLQSGKNREIALHHITIFAPVATLTTQKGLVAMTSPHFVFSIFAFAYQVSPRAANLSIMPSALPVPIATQETVSSATHTSIPILVASILSRP